MMALGSILRNSAAVAVGKFADKVLAALCGIVLARALGPERLGTYAFVFAYLGFYDIVSQLGIRDVLARETSRRPDAMNRLVGASMCLRLLASVTVLLLANLVIWIFPDLAGVRAYMLLASLPFLLSFSALYNVAMQVRMRMERVTLVGLMSGSMKLLLFFAVASAAGGIRGFILAGLAAAVLGFILMVVVSRDLVQPEFRANRRLWGGLLRDAWPLIVVQGLTMVYHRVDQVMLYNMVAVADVGQYATAVRVAETMRIIPMAIMTPLFPLLSVAWTRNRDGFFNIYAAAVTTTMACSFLVVLLVQLAGAPLISLLYGSAYAPAAPVATILVWAELAVFFHLINACVLIAMNLQRLLIVIIGISAGLNILLNLLLIPGLGTRGAALATLASYCMLPLSVACFGASRSLLPAAVRASWRVLLPGALSALAGTALSRFAGAPAALALAAGVTLYAVGLLGQRHIREWLRAGFLKLRERGGPAPPEPTP